MADTVICESHGETVQTFVCCHLSEESSGLGFNRNDPTTDHPYPDAWCDSCELIRVAHDGWTDEAQGLTQIKLVCADCYEQTRIRNTRPSVTLDDLSHLRWKCGSCEEWHTGPILDLSFDEPAYWLSKYHKGTRWDVLPSGTIRKEHLSFLDEDYCAIDDEQFFVRGVLHLPIIGTTQSFGWGVWGSLSRANFEALLKNDLEPGRTQFQPMFSYLSSQISAYPDTLSLPMNVHIQALGMRPHFHLKRSEHPLAKEFYEGIQPERVRELMFLSLPTQPE